MFNREIRERSTRIVQGAGCIARLAEFVPEFGRRVLLVTDTGIEGAGHIEPVKLALQMKQIDVHVFDDVAENPTTDDVVACAEFARELGIDAIIGFGGGSSMDTAKGANFLITNGGVMADYKGHQKNAVDLLPMIAVPTTTGTGSEAQRFAVLSVPDSKMKMACGDPTCAPRLAFLDPELVKTQPPLVAALTGIDALSHAVETGVTRAKNPVSLIHSHEAWRLITAHLPAVLRGEANDADWEAMQWASCLAGMAIESSMLGAAHAAANPLTAKLGTTHGQAVGLLLPHVMRFNGEDNERIDTVESLLQLSGLETSLTALGLDPVHIPDMANQASLQWTGQFNPRKVSVDDFAGLYKAAL